MAVIRLQRGTREQRVRPNPLPLRARAKRTSPDKVRNATSTAKQEERPRRPGSAPRVLFFQDSCIHKCVEVPVPTRIKNAAMLKLIRR